MTTKYLLALLGLQAYLAAAQITAAPSDELFAKCPGAADANKMANWQQCYQDEYIKVDGSCGFSKNEKGCLCSWASIMATSCMPILCPPDVGSSFLDLYTCTGAPTGGLPAATTSGAGPTITTAPGSPTGGSGPTNTAAGAPAATSSRAAAGSMVVPVVGGLAAGMVGALAVYL